MDRERRRAPGPAWAAALVACALAPRGAAAEAPPVVLVGVGDAGDLAVKAAASAARQLGVVALTLPTPAPETPPPLKAITAALGRAGRAFGAFDLEEADRRLAEARALLEPHAGARAVVSLEREALVLAVSLAHASRDDRGIDRALEAYARRFPGQPPPPRTPWPPAVLTRLERRTPARDAMLTVRVEPAGAAVSIDGEPATAGTPIALVPGAHRIEVEQAGYLPEARVITVAAGPPAAVDVALELDLVGALAAAAPDRALAPEVTAALRARAGVGARVFLVGRAGRGARFVELGGDAVARATDVDRRALGAALDRLIGPATPAVSVAPAAASPPAWAWLAVGAGAAAVGAVGAGIGVRVSAVSIEDELISRDGALTQVEAFALRDEAEGRATVGSALLIGGLALAAGVATWLWLAPPD